MKSQLTPPGQEVAKPIIEIDLLTQLQIAEKEKQDLKDELEKLKARFDYVQKATQDVVWDWDLEKNIGWYSEGLHTLFGYDPKQPLDWVKFWYDSIHPGDREGVINGIHTVIDKGGKNWHDHYRFKKSDGSYAWVYDRGYAIHNSDGKPIRMVGSMQDITTEVEAKEALRESEEKFRGAFDQVAVGISISAPDGRFLSVNKAYPKIFGYTQEELLQKKISDLSHPDEIEGDRKLINDLLAGRAQTVAREKKYIHKSGKILWGRVFGTVIYDSNGAPKYIVGVLEDVTEEREVHNVLTESEERLRLVIESGKIGTWDFYPQSKKLYWDARCRAMFGMTTDDYVDYEVFLNTVHPDDRKAADEANQNAINGLNNGDYDLEYRTIGVHDQKLRWIRAKGRSYKDEQGMPFRYAGTVIDITEEKNQEQRLREQEQRFRLLATSIPQIIWTTDEDGIVDYMSDKWKAHTGQTPTYSKFSFRELMHPDDLQRVIPEWEDCRAKGITYQGEYRLKNILTNEYRWFHCTTAPLKDNHGKTIKWIGSATDIHDQKMTEERLENKVAERTRELTLLNEQLEKSNSELEQYAYVTSHDLKEPLRKIQIYHNMITAKYGDQLDPGVLEYLSKIDTASIRMSGLINDLLQYSKLSNAEVLNDLVDLNHVVNTVTAEFEHSLRQKNIAVDTKELPSIKAVPVQIHQLFFNLFSNSIKFSKQDTHNRISIVGSVLPDSEKGRYPLLKAPGRYFKIVFQDEGIGFSSKYGEQIFTIFQRLNNRKDFEGHGIGLALCRRIVGNHGGVMWATGEENKGATFTIILPEGNPEGK